MPKKYKERSLIEFQKAFPDNKACAKHLAEQQSPIEMPDIVLRVWWRWMIR